MAEEVFSRNTFDPRRHSAVAMAVSERMPFYGPNGSKAEQVAMKHWRIGPNVPPASLSVRRPMTAPAARKLPNGTLDAQPKFLNQNGKWVQDEMPALIAESQAQPLTATSTFTATLPGAAAGRSVRPVAAVHTYNDVSPVISADMVHDADMELTHIKESTLERPRTAAPSSLRAAQAAAAADKSHLTPSHSPSASGMRGGASRRPASAVPVPSARAKSIESFWARQAGTEFNLGISELERTVELGKNVCPGAANCRLVGSRWKYIERPVDGDVVYTDYYGRCGPKLDEFYGRAYHVQPSQFSKNRLVGDGDYAKVQASMQGIHTLRTKPGLVLDTTIVNGPSSRLEGLSVYAAKTARGLHRMNEYARMAPLGERDLRPTWAAAK